MQLGAFAILHSGDAIGISSVVGAGMSVRNRHMWCLVLFPLCLHNLPLGVDECVMIVYGMYVVCSLDKRKNSSWLW